LVSLNLCIVNFSLEHRTLHLNLTLFNTTNTCSSLSIGLTGTNARPSIAPTYGVDPMLGTNPITFGIPSSDPFPFVIDCATSVNQRGKLEKYARDGLDTPRGAVIDHMGVERTDTEGILRDMELGKCALTPLGGAGDAMGGYKGTVQRLLFTLFDSMHLIFCCISLNILSSTLSVVALSTAMISTRVRLGSRCRAPLHCTSVGTIRRRYLWN
jgi:hypothetical protein